MSSTSSEKKLNLSRTTYHHHNLREALIDAGLTNLAEKSGTELSLREIARQVGVSANAAYRHFSNKESFLIALAAYGFRKLNDKQKDSISIATDAIEGMKNSGMAYINFAQENPALFRLMFSHFESNKKDSELRKAMLESYHQLCLTISNALQKPLENPIVHIKAVHALALVHGLSQLSIDGQLQEWIGDPNFICNAVLSEATDLQILNAVNT